ncbi:MAG: hypothetical protein OXG11_01005 [Chloroflexi bacterium]|nr:hypothetical protein [Chloroflexota bacterium]
MQLNLIFPGTRDPHADLWTALDEKARSVVLERLADVIANAARAKPRAEGTDRD